MNLAIRFTGPIDAILDGRPSQFLHADGFGRRVSIHAKPNGWCRVFVWFVERVCVLRKPDVRLTHWKRPRESIKEVAVYFLRAKLTDLAQDVN